MKKLLYFILPLLLLSSCVGKKKYTAIRGKYDQMKVTYDQLSGDLSNCSKERETLRKNLSDLNNDLRRKNEELADKQKKISDLEAQLEYMKKTNNNLLDRLEDLSVVSKSGAESIRKSLESLNEQSKYIKDLNTSVHRKDSLNLGLITTLKRSLDDINDSDVNIEVKKGVVYISISDKMLFKTGSSEISPQADNVLGKIARIINDQRDFDVLVEGHTDNVPINTSCLVDNWDLSVKRATSIVRNLQQKHGVQPSRMTAGGRSEYVPKTGNESVEGKSLNRRTEIILLPKLDQFFQLLDSANKK
jgi:chemotaxis protein MotB